MKLSCEIVQDLLPLYEDEICSQASRTAVEEHLKTCPACRGQVENIRNFPEPELPREISGEDKVVVRSFRKVRRRWFASLICVLLVIPMIWMSINQVRGEGICFSNLDDIWAARRYCAALARGDFEKAAGYMDYESLYEEIQEVLSWEPEDYLVDYHGVTVGGERYMATGNFDRSALEDEGAALDFWCDVVYNGLDGYLVPEAVWQAVIKVDTEAVEMLNEGVYQVNGHNFYRMETDGGMYYTAQMDLQNCTAPEVLARNLDLIPLWIFRECEDLLKAESMEAYEFNQTYYADAKDMTYEEFEAYVKAHYAADLQSIADQGYFFEIGGYEDSYYVEANGGWSILHGMKLSNADGSHRFSIDLLVGDNGLRLVGMIEQNEASLDMDLAEILFFGYPDAGQ